MLPYFVFAVCVEPADRASVNERARGDDTIRVSVGNAGTESTVIEGRTRVSEARNCRHSIAFLIDTLPIRNVSKSLDCFIGTHFNRHSSETTKLDQNCAVRKNSLVRAAQILNRVPEKAILIVRELNAILNSGGKQ
jgi:hypothetical protein